MKVEYTFSPKSSVLKLQYEYENTDRTQYLTIEKKKISAANRQCVYHLPPGFDIDKLHKDRLALVMLLQLYSFIGKRLVLPFPVSKEFAEAVRERLAISIVTPDDGPRPAAEHFANRDHEALHPALCFSSGVDSTAALLTMPEDTVLVFSDRIQPLGVSEMYLKDNAYRGLQYVNSMVSNPLYIVPTDMEYMRTRRGFVIDIAVGNAAILLSDHLGLRSIGYGYSLHNYTHYGDGKLNCICTGDYCRFNHPQWNAVFQAAGLFLNFATAGLSEIGTLKVVMDSAYEGVSNGCMRGRLGKSCYNCGKCYRKLLVKSYMKNGKTQPNKELLARLTKTNLHKKKAIYDESSMIMAWSYIFQRYNPGNTTLLGLKKAIDRDNPYKYKDKIRYAEKWFNGADSYVDPICLPTIKKRLNDEYGIKETL